MNKLILASDGMHIIIDFVKKSLKYTILYGLLLVNKITKNVVAISN